MKKGKDIKYLIKDPLIDQKTKDYIAFSYTY